MTEINHKAVYECRAVQAAIHTARQKMNEAKKAVESAEADFRARCAKVSEVPIGDLDFSNVMCMANGISAHVYHIKVSGRYGSPQNKCIFCGCDNYDDGM